MPPKPSGRIPHLFDYALRDRLLSTLAVNDRRPRSAYHRRCGDGPRVQSPRTQNKGPETSDESRFLDLSMTLVELPGSRPPGPKSRTAAFSRLSTDFVLDAPASRYRNQTRRSSG